MSPAWLRREFGSEFGSGFVRHRAAILIQRARPPSAEQTENGNGKMSDRIHEGREDAGRLDAASTYDGVLTRRVLAFCIDYLFIAILLVPFGILIFLFGLLTLGLGWLLFAVLVPAVAAIYIWNTLGGRRQATPGMRMMGLRLERMDGARIDGMLAVVHGVVFWASVAVLTPLILLATLFLERRRALHDLLLGTVVVRDDR